MSMRKAFSQISEQKCHEEKQKKMVFFFIDTIHSNLKTSKKDCAAHFKKWLDAVPQEGSGAAPTDHQWDLGSYLSLEFWKIIIPSDSLKCLIPESFRMYIPF